MKKGCSLIIILLSTSTISMAQDRTYVAPDVNIISVTPVQGSGLDIDRVPGKIQTINRAQLGKKRIYQLQKH